MPKELSKGHESPAPGRGGARPGAGRKPGSQPRMARFTVTLPADLAEHLAKLGDGNLSAGIRRMAEQEAR